MSANVRIIFDSVTSYSFRCICPISSKDFKVTTSKFLPAKKRKKATKSPISHLHAHSF